MLSIYVYSFLRPVNFLNTSDITSVNNLGENVSLDLSEELFKLPLLKECYQNIFCCKQKTCKKKPHQ